MGIISSDAESKGIIPFTGPFCRELYSAFNSVAKVRNPDYEKNGWKTDFLHPERSKPHDF